LSSFYLFFDLLLYYFIIIIIFIPKNISRINSVHDLAALGNLALPLRELSYNLICFHFVFFLSFLYKFLLLLLLLLFFDLLLYYFIIIIFIPKNISRINSVHDLAALGKPALPLLKLSYNLIRFHFIFFLSFYFFILFFGLTILFYYYIILLLFSYPKTSPG
jgi:hypothetical protein